METEIHDAQERKKAKSEVIVVTSIGGAKCTRFQFIIDRQRNCNATAFVADNTERLAEFAVGSHN